MSGQGVCEDSAVSHRHLAMGFCLAVAAVFPVGGCDTAPGGQCLQKFVRK